MIRVIFFAAALCLCACTANEQQSLHTEPLGEHIVYVIARGWHTDIGLPVEEIGLPLARVERGFPGVRFLTFGFGERQFLLDHRHTPLTMLSAMLPSRSALLMTALRATPQQAFGQGSVVALHISRADLQAIEAQLWQELETSPDGTPIVLANGPYPGSVFFAAQDTYDGLFTCNTWTAAILRAGGLRMPTAGVLFASQVMGMARWIGRRQGLPVRG